MLSIDNGLGNWIVVDSDTVKNGEEHDDDENISTVEILDSYGELESDSENTSDVYKDDYEELDQHGDGYDMLVDILSKNKRIYKALNATGLRLEVKFSEPKIADIYERLKLCISEHFSIMEKELDIQPQDRVGIVFNNTNNVRCDFSLSFRPFSQYSTDF